MSVLIRLVAAMLCFAISGAQAMEPVSGGNRFTEQLPSPEVLKSLRDGGYTLYLRHGETDNSRADHTVHVDPKDCNTQRLLNAEGRKTATLVGQAMRRARIPVGEIHVSPLCRTRETLALAFPGRQHTIEPRLMYTANLTMEQKRPVLAFTRELMSSPVAAGSNRLIIAHGPNLADLIGYFPKEGTLVIFKSGAAATEPFTYIASIPPAHWAALLP